MRKLDRKIWLNWKLACAMLIAMASAGVAAGEWPQELTLEGGTIVVYQPQPESLNGRTFTGRAAMSIEIQDKAPIYGVFWFTSTIETDRSTDSVNISNVAVTKVTWPDSKDTDEQRFTQIAEQALEGASFDASLSALTSSLATANNVKQSLEEINNDPPQITFSQALSVLLSYDGKPYFQAVEDSPFERALNTPLLVVRDTRNQQYFLTSGSLWYQAKDALGPWSQTTNPPSDLVAMIPTSDEPAPAAIPAIVVATEATELVVSKGKPDWVSLAGGKLLYVENTETPWLRDLAGGNMYLQLSGRWFRSENEQGPWTFVRADKLPDAFKEIPPASAIGGVRSSVAGTEEADDAVANAQIPQTTAIKRDEASLTVKYDGKPNFEDIKDTQVAYAVNTAAQVLRIGDKYYAVDNGVWFISLTATGPWVVADTIPSDEIAKIPPSSPVYNTTYVTIYNATPEVVYVGYTPGYMWSYPYYGVPVYGTGYYYPPYYGNFYYPRAPTWGFHVGYKPWNGWNYGVSWGGPFFRVGVSWGGGYGHGYYPGRCCGGRYGGGYHHNDININTGDINIGNNVNVGNRRNAKNDFSNRQRNSNIYSSDKNRHRNADRSTASANMKTARSNSARKNNVYASKDGQVARRNTDQWQVRDNNKWSNVAPENKPSRASVQSRDIPKRNVSKPSSYSKPASRPTFNHSNMNQHFNARSRGARSSGRMQRRR
jgi:hypothetical protein